jgi:hypothetical protein
MRVEDLTLVSNLGQSLWFEPEQSSAITRETVSAVSFLDSNPDRAAEKTVQALLDRANKKVMYARAASGFHSLFPEERFILLALHSGRWSYERIATVVREPLEMVQQLAWNARVHLALSHYPAAPKTASESCPEYNPQRPWTQKFMDEELTGQEKVFLQTHLTSCEHCRQALLRAKEVYYSVQKTIADLQEKVPLPGLTAQLHTLAEQGLRLRSPSTVSNWDLIATFVRRTEVRFILLAWVVALVIAFRR